MTFDWKTMGFRIRRDMYRVEGNSRIVFGPGWFYRKSPDGDLRMHFNLEECPLGNAHLEAAPLKFIGFDFPECGACNPI